MLKDLNKKNLDKSIVLIANSSKYLMHYRFLLINELDAVCKNLFVIAPQDKSTNELKKKVRYKLWQLSPGMEFNFFDITKSFFVLFSLIKSLKPDLVHSHTLKPNLMISIVNSLFGIKTVLSFPGMGRLSTSNGVKYIFFKFILKFIYLASIYQLENFIFFRRNFNRVKFIFQNPIDLNFFMKVVKVDYNKNFFHLIPGSGVPSNYLKSIKHKTSAKNKLDFIYCARLERSKGIDLFISLSEYYPQYDFIVYGELNTNSKNCLNYDEIKFFQRKNKNLKFMDYLKDPLLSHHNDNTIFLVPSNYGEGLPRGILEAMSLEIPVVASKKACVGLFDNKTLFMVSDNRIESYINAVEEIIYRKKEGKLDKFLNNSKKYIKKNYEEYFIVGQTLDLYNSFD